MQFISTCNRSVRTDFTPRMYYTCNPGGVGHAWVKRLFIDRRYRASERAEDYVFIPARVTDNPVLMRDKSYVITLENLQENDVRHHVPGRERADNQINGNKWHEPFQARQEYQIKSDKPDQHRCKGKGHHRAYS